MNTVVVFTKLLALLISGFRQACDVVCDRAKGNGRGRGQPGDNLRTQAKLESIIGDLAEQGLAGEKKKSNKTLTS